MLLQDVDEKINTNMREEAFSCRRKCAMTSSGSRILQRRNACDRICTPGVCASKVGPDEYRIERDATENGSTVAPQRKTFNINEDVRRRVPRHRNTDVNDVSSGCVCTCPVICIDSTKETRPSVTVSSDALACEDDEFAVIRLSLRKPRRWKWKLTTCASSPAVILLDERGDLLIDTAMRPGTPVDSNGNDTGVQPSRRTQRNGWEQRDICAEYREGDRLRSRKVTERPVRDFEQKQKDDLMKSVSLREGLRSMIPQRSGPETRGRSLDASVRSTSTQSRSASDVSVKDRRLSPRSKARRHFVLRRRNCADSSTSSDSSSDVSATTARRGRNTGGRSLPSHEEAKGGSDVSRLKKLHRRRSSSRKRKGRHDPTSGSPATSRRIRRRQQGQNLSSFKLDSGMGSNVSRHSEKGLSGRRTQSSGNLCNGNKILAPSVGRILVPCSGGVGPKDRNKFCGSLPNHLDSKHCDLPDACCNGNNNNGEHTVPKNECDDVELRLHPLPPPYTLDPAALHDQGYGSERSPEEEHPPSLPGMPELTSKYPFITREATSEVRLLKSSRGLGLSVTGGVDSGEQWPGLVRIKRLFQHQPAWQSGQLAQGDVLLAANGVHLIGLTNYEALEVLRTTPNNVVLTVCRPPSDVFCAQGPSEPPPPPPPPPRRDPAHSVSCHSQHVLPLPPLQTDGPCGEFDIVLTKVNRSLGFTLRKEDESVLGHYVRALVREPALSDGRIRPGDKIVAVNDADISPMSHEEAVMFLRQCGDRVKLRLYRDASQTPVSALSPTDEAKTFKPKPLLRKEAIDMLSDLAVKKLSPCDSSSSSYGKLHRVSDRQSSSPCSSPRRRRLTKTPSPDVHGATLDRLGQKYMVTSHVGNSDSSGEQSQASTFTYPSMDSTKARGDASSFASTAGSGDSIDMKPQRPNFLDLCGGSATPCASRKKKFTFSVAATGDDEWDSVAVTSESDELATNMTLGSVSQCYPTTSDSSEEFRTDGVGSNDPNCDGSLPTEPASMPPLTNLSSTSSTSTAFSYRNPAYQSAHPGCYASNSQSSMRKNSDDVTERASDQDIPGKLFNCQAGSGGNGSRGLLKWKGIVFTPENDEVGNSNISTFTDDSSTQLTVDRESEQENQVFMVELTRGWNSRLGFSLRGDGHHTYISAIYADSVAAKDGRLQAGDQVLMVNDENVDNMSTAEVIDLLRKIRGTIGITVLRKSGPNLQVS